MSLPEITTKYIDPSTYPVGISFMDGQYFDMSQARISILDYGFLHSDATYDVVHVWDGAFFRLEKYLDRFFTNFKKLRMNIPYSKTEVADILYNCVALSGHKQAYVEMICTRGTSPTFSRDPRDAENRFIAFAIPFGSVANPDQMIRGIHASISDIIRIPPSTLDPTIKNYHWLDLVNGLYDAYENQAETCILMGTDGNITEGPGFNIFSVKNGKIRTPESGVLHGITRQTVFDLCGLLNLSCEATTVSVDELASSDEVFISSTAGGIMPITKLNGKIIGSGDTGPVFHKLKDLYWEKHLDPDWSRVVNYG